MSSIHDWAAVAAQKIRGEFRGCKEGPSQERIAAIIDYFSQPWTKLLREAKRGHYHCDDSWYCCGKCTHPDHSDESEDYLPSHAGEASRKSGVCNCGAEEWNAKIDAALAGAD